MDWMRRLLVASVMALCAMTIAASCFLALSYVTLKGVDDLRPLTTLAVFVGEAAFVLFALNTIPTFRVSVVALMGAFGIAWIGASMMSQALAASHFEGYAVLMGAIAASQGTLAASLF